MTTIVVVGALMLIIFAVTIGLLSDRHARDAAWRRIAVARRRLHEKELHLIALEQHKRCEGCPLEGFFRDEYGE